MVRGGISAHALDARAVGRRCAVRRRHHRLAAGCGRGIGVLARLAPRPARVRPIRARRIARSRGRRPGRLRARGLARTARRGWSCASRCCSPKRCRGRCIPWDAWSHWATKARVWFELKSMAPFVAASEWLQAAGTRLHRRQSALSRHRAAVAGMGRDRAGALGRRARQSALVARPAWRSRWRSTAFSRSAASIRCGR